MQTLNVKNEEEMIKQLKILLNNGYDVGVHKEVLLFGDALYLIAYQRPNKRSDNN